MTESSESSAQPWDTNPLVTNIRPWTEKYAEYCYHDSLQETGTGVTQLDVILQAMLVSCSYEPHQIWQGNDELVEDIAKKVRTGQTRKVAGASRQMESAIGREVLRLNKPLLFDVLNSQTKRLQELAVRNRDVYSPSGRLPSAYSTVLHRIQAERKLGWVERRAGKDQNGYQSATASTGQPNEYIIYKSVDRPVSRALAETRHYIHNARDDELVAFGAFLPYAEFPFAWVSYSKPWREYKRKMLAHSGADPDASLELTRAWETEGAPRNTLSMLYAYAHEALRRSWRRSYGCELDAVITAVDPNLGFLGSSFRAVGFQQIGAKATKYAFYEDPSATGHAFYKVSSGTRHYVTRRGAEAGHDSGSAPQLLPSQFPLLDTHELVLNFKSRGKKTIDLPILRHAGAEYAMAG